MTDEQRQIQQLTYALGLAIGALETVRVCRDEFDEVGLRLVLERLKNIADHAYVVVHPPKEQL